MNFYEHYSDMKKYFYFHKQGEYFSENEIYRIACMANFHRSWEFVFITKGELKYNINGNVGNAGKNSIVFINSMQIHSYQTSDDIDGYVLVVSSDYLIYFEREYPKMTFPNVMDDAEYNVPIIEHVEKWYNNREETDYSRFNNINLLIAMLCEAYLTTKKKKEPTQELVLNIINYIEQHYDDADITMEKIAGQLGFVKQYCSKVFNNTMGESFRNYLNRIRIMRFEELAAQNENESVMTLAMECGFESMATFYRAYKNLYNRSPKHN